MINIFDIGLGVVVGLSSLVGLYRGLIAECLTLASWIIACLCAYFYSDQFAFFLTPYIQSPTLRLVTMTILLIVLLIMLTKTVGYFMQVILRITGLKSFDHILGIGFGAARGWLILICILGAMSFFHLDKDDWFKNSKIVPHVHRSQVLAYKWMPQSFKKYARLTDETFNKSTG